MIAGLIARVRSLWTGARRPDEIDADMQEEFRLHQEMRTDDLIRSGLTPEAARRQARVEFGSPDKYQDAGRESRGLHRIHALRVSWLDFKLGFRMLAKYPGITVIGGLAMAFAIWMGAATFEVVTQILDPKVPLPAGDRIVALRNWDIATNRAHQRAVHDFIEWREQLRSVQDIGAFRDVQRNLVTSDGAGGPVAVAEISAAGFRVARTPALLGRPIVTGDESADAPPVLVLGYQVWRLRFDSDSTIIGKPVRLGHVVHTVVGVMPEGFAFPVAHNLWVPLRIDALAHPRGQGPAIGVFGRLAPGASLAEARAELATLGTRMASEFPETHAQLRPHVMAYTKSVIDLPGVAQAAVVSANLPLVMLLVLICGNVALLMFARAAARESEIVVRSALGASRSRIVMQLFAEALVLGAVAAVIGLAAAEYGVGWVFHVVAAEMRDGLALPFWFQPRLSAPTVLYAALLTLLAAAIAGVMPALKLTRSMGTRLKESSAGAGGLRFGGVWTVVIIVQVALTVAFPVVAALVRRDSVQVEHADVGVPAHEYLTVRVEMDREPPPGAPRDTTLAGFRARFAKTHEELKRVLESDPAVVAVTYADRLPGMYHPYRLVELDDGGAAPLNPQWPAYRVSQIHVDPEYFGIVEAPILNGRGFHSGDIGDSARVTVVNESFVRLVLGGRNPIGRQLRYVHFEEWSSDSEREPGPWFEIVGVVPDMGTLVGTSTTGDPKVAGIYHPVAPGAVRPAYLAVHVRGNPMDAAPSVRAAAMQVDPGLRLYELRVLDDVNAGELEFLAFWFRIAVMVSIVALTLSLAGIYAVMAFTVSRRTREIGIRVALGAERWRILVAIFRRPAIQVATGIVAGTALTFVLSFGIEGGELSAKFVAMMLAYSTVMMGVCMLACIVPTRRALSIEPTEALKAE